MGSFKKTDVRYFLYSTLIILIFSSEVLANKTVTIILKSGERYDNVTYKINKQYKVIEFEQEGWKKNISFNDIETIIDKEGNDITAKVLGSYHKPSNETWLSERSEVIKKARAKVWDIVVRLGGNYSFPLGDYYEGIDAGVGFEGDLRFAINHQIAIRMIVSQSGMNAGDDLYLIPPDPDISILDQELKFRNTRYLVAGEYYKHFDKDKKDLSMWYAYSGIGADTHTFFTKATLQQKSTGQIAFIDEKTSESKLALTFGIGIIKMVSNSVGLDFAASYDLVQIGRDSAKKSYVFEDNIIYAYIFDFKIGITTFF